MKSRVFATKTLFNPPPGPARTLRSARRRRRVRLRSPPCIVPAARHVTGRVFGLDGENDAAAPYGGYGTGGSPRTGTAYATSSAAAERTSPLPLSRRRAPTFTWPTLSAASSFAKRRYASSHQFIASQHASTHLHPRSATGSFGWSYSARADAPGTPKSSKRCMVVCYIKREAVSPTPQGRQRKVFP